MESITILLLILQGAAGLVMFFMKMAHDNTIRRLNLLENDVRAAVMKDDFREFKEELFKRLDRLENELLRKPNV